MFEVYLDESGVHESASVCVISGYFGGFGQWKKCELSWRKLLDGFEVPLEEFHAKDLMRRKGFFSGWTDRNWNKFLEGIAYTIRKYKIYPVTFGIIVADFKSLPLGTRRFVTGAHVQNGRFTTSGNPRKPYFVPFQNCLKAVSEHLPSNAKADYFFGLDRPFTKYASTLFRRMKESAQWPYSQNLGEITTPLAKETPQLQVADFLAYLSYVHMQETAKQGRQIYPGPLLLEALRRTRRRQDHSFQDRKCLLETIEGYPIPES